MLSLTKSLLKLYALVRRLWSKYGKVQYPYRDLDVLLPSTQAISQIGGSYELLFTALRINTLQLVMFIPERSLQPTPFGFADSLGWETRLLSRNKAGGRSE